MGTPTLVTYVQVWMGEQYQNISKSNYAIACIKLL